MSDTPDTEEPIVLLDRPALHVARLTLNRPRARNAISAAMAETIERLVAEVEADRAIRVGIVAANGSSFCAGADLKELAAGRGAALITPTAGFAGFVYGTRKKPWIAAVQGAAHAGGAEIAIACDMIIAGEDANFALPEVKRGVIPGAGGAFRIARVLPRPLALELVTTGGTIDARRAHAIGLINRVVPNGQLLAEAIALATVIAENSPMAVREALQITRAAADREDELLRRLESEAVARLLASPDLVEGATAFVEKRAPVWRT
jgi:enoyl-CoA hydratase/carnithine racemase